jgi:hypothetical protein
MAGLWSSWRVLEICAGIFAVILIQKEHDNIFMKNSKKIMSFYPLFKSGLENNFGKSSL